VLTSNRFLRSLLVYSECDVSGASCDVEHLEWFFTDDHLSFIVSDLAHSHGPDHPDEGVLPAPVYAETHGIVHHIVALRHAAENLAHHLFLVLAVDVLEAEVDFLLCLLGLSI